MRQLIIARKDLQMSPGKLAAQVSHASLAFITTQFRDRENVIEVCAEGAGTLRYEAGICFDKETYEDWICGVFTKTVCEAKNRNQLMKAVTIAEELGLVEGEDYFLIKDCCLTELTPEEVDDNGVGRVLTCVGFKPLPDDIAHKISKKFQLYK